MVDFLCMCFASRRSADFQFDIEKFSLHLDKSGNMLQELIGDGIHQIFEGAKVEESDKLRKEEVDKLVQEMTDEGFHFPMDVWAFDFDRSGCMTLNEFKAVVMTALNTRKENFIHFFRQLKEGKKQARDAWEAAGLKIEWTMTKPDVAMVLEDDVDGCMSTYGLKKGDQLVLSEFQQLYADYLAQLHLHPDRENIEKIKTQRSMNANEDSNLSTEVDEAGRH